MIKNMLALITIAVLAPALSSAETPASGPTQEEMIEQFRIDLQAKSSDVMAKGLTLTSEQAAKFWPLFETFQKEQSAIVDGQLKATQKYGEQYASLSDAEALTYVNALLERDARIHDLRVKWPEKFQKVVPPKVAARAIQLDRRLGQVTQVGLSSRIPLIN